MIIGADFVPDLVATVGETNVSLFPLIVFAVAIPLGFYIMRRLVGVILSGMPKR